MTENKDQIVRREYFTPSQLRIREVPGEEESRTITGYAILFDVPSAPLWCDEDGEAREIIDAGAVTRELLDGSDIKMTMFHNRQLLMARSNQGKGSLSYEVDDKGVSFSFEAPRTVDGEKALELVRRGDIGGCSFAFTTRYWDDACVDRVSRAVNSRTEITYRVKVITGIYDFTLTDSPAYPDTSVEVRDHEEAREASERTRRDNMRKHIAAMREAARKKII